MHCRHIIISLVACAMISGCVRDYQEKPETDPPVLQAGNTVSGKVRIKVSEEFAKQLEQMADDEGVIRNIGVKSADDILAGFEFESMRRTFPPAGRFEERTRKEGLHLWYTVTFNPEISVTKAGGDISGIQGVDHVEGLPKISRPAFKRVPAEDIVPTKATAATDIFNDPMLYQQWHYYNDGSYRGTAGCDVNVVPAWKSGYYGSPDVIVAVIDGGIDYDHEDLKDNVWINEAELNGEPGVDDDGNGYVDDIYGYDFVWGYPIRPDDHGTHVAGTIAAVNDNGIGVCGIAGGNSSLGIPGVKVMSGQIFYGDWDSASDVAPVFKYAADNGAVIAQNSWGYEIGTIFDADKEAIDYFIKYAGIDENGNQTGPMKGGLVVFAGGNEDNPFSSPGGYEKVIGVSALAADFEKAYYSNYGEWCDIAAPGGDTFKDQYVLSTVTNNRYEGYQGTSMACPHVSGIAALILSIYGGDGFTPDMLWDMLVSTANPIIYEGHNSRFNGQLGSGLIDVGAILGTYNLTPPQPVSDLVMTDAGTTYINLSWTVPANGDGEAPTGFNLYYSTEEFDTTFDPRAVPEGISMISLDNSAAVGDKAEYLLEGLEDGTAYYIAIVTKDDASMSEFSEIMIARTQKNLPPELTDRSRDLNLPGIGYSLRVDLNDYFTDANGDELRFSCSSPEGAAVNASIEGNTMTVKALAAGQASISVMAVDILDKNISGVFNVKVVDSGLEYFCYPNPVIDVMYIRSSSEDGSLVNIIIESETGKEVYNVINYRISSTSPEAIDLSGLGTGNYTVIITDVDGKTTTQNIMKL